MSAVVSIPQKDLFERDIFYLFVDDFGALPTKFDLASENYVLLIACDSASVETETIYQWASELIKNGLAYLCAWGNDCGRFHDIVDEAAVMREISEQKEFPTIMTTWHSDDSLDEALWFALNAAHPDDKLEEECRSVLIITVGNKDWDTHLRQKLSDLNIFNAIVLEEENNPNPKSEIQNPKLNHVSRNF